MNGRFSEGRRAGDDRSRSLELLRLASAGAFSRSGDLGDLRQPAGGSLAHGHVRPEAERARGIRGLFNPIQTNVEGIEISEHPPKLAACADKYTILRGVSHTLGAHRLGQEYINTGTRPLASLEYPGYGAVVTKERPGSMTCPGSWRFPTPARRARFLGVKYAPLNTGETPKRGGRSPSAGSPWPTA
ncbi:MAG: hypothetical protein CM1200mP2_50100 [Planctomycetaceae bacterium]|nr:MAG: hypothetical protein CM1200mP2_50100 [Planctomycetaceae bacterium]